jgi:signal transduction histidine kinase
MARQQQEKLQFTSRLVTMGELASSLAHELNQPLSAIANYCMGSVTRLKAGKVKPEDILPAMEKASAQAQRAGNVIRRIREFVKRKAPNRRACTIETIVEDAVSFAELDAKVRMAQIQTTFKGELTLVRADPILIEQVLLNLIKNAMDAMRHLSPQDRIIEVLAEQQEKYVKVSVMDRGCGVPEYLKEKLFESFFSTKADGMGMGLNICRGIIEYHEGCLWVDEREGQGSLFCFTLPIATPNDEPITNTIQESEI